MIGGKVISVQDKHDRTTVWCLDPKSNDECCVDVELGHEIACGDTVWWQGKKAFWTDKYGAFSDREINKIGYSYQPPATQEPRDE